MIILKEMIVTLPAAATAPAIGPTLLLSGGPCGAFRRSCSTLRSCGTFRRSCGAFSSSFSGAFTSSCSTLRSCSAFRRSSDFRRSCRRKCYVFKRCKKLTVQHMRLLANRSLASRFHAGPPIKLTSQRVNVVELKCT